MNHDVLADILSVIKNQERIGRSSWAARASSLGREVLKLMQARGYIGAFELVDDGKGGRFKVSLLGRVNDCNVVKPRFSVRKGEWQKWEKRFLPAAQVGVLIVSTPAGVMDHRSAQAQGLGGRLLGFVY